MPTRRAVLLAALAAPMAVPRPTWAQSSSEPAPTILRLQTRQIEVNGKPATVYGIMQPDGTHGIVTQVGKRFRVQVENRIDQPSLIHWHGLTPPWYDDGVPGISGPPIPAGGDADYDFPLRFGGSFWMHSHQGLQEQRLMAAPLIIHDERDKPGRQEIVLMLADFSFTAPETIYENLRRTGSMAGMAAEKAPMPGMKMDMPAEAGPDLNDVKYDAFLANDRTLADPEVVVVEPGAEVLVRVINSSAMTAFHFDLGALDGTLIAVDGFEVEPIVGRRFPIAVAQRLDIVLKLPSGPSAHPLLAQVEGERNRTGIVLRAGNAPVARIADTAEKASPALTLDLERRLRARDPLTARPVDRVHRIDLTGNMAGYIWSLNNVSWTPSVPPLPIAKGERVELVMTNRTPMPHPMHLHGHEFQVVEIDGKRQSGAVRDTVLVPPHEQVVVAFDANNSPGRWAFHCHLLYHLDAGMFTTLQYV